MVTENDEDEFMAKFASLLFGKLQPEMMERGEPYSMVPVMLLMCWHILIFKPRFSNRLVSDARRPTHCVDSASF